MHELPRFIYFFSSQNVGASTLLTRRFYLACMGMPFLIATLALVGPGFAAF